MTEHSTTHCVLFPELFVRPVVVQFDQAQGSSDGGAVLLKAADQRLVQRPHECRRITGTIRNLPGEWEYIGKHNGLRRDRFAERRANFRFGPPRVKERLIDEMQFR